MTEQKTTGGQAQTMRAQNVANAVVRTLLHTPGISRGVGKRLVIINVTGRKTGRRYSIPVAYTRHDGDLLVGTPFGWARNMRTGEPVEIVLQGRRRQADVQVISDEAGVVAAYAVMCRDNHQFAKFNRISIGADGSPDASDLHHAWAAGARAFRLSPR
jgi:deazaflavin-dependent oxidoreductase (nitroreductase family)